MFQGKGGVDIHIAEQGDISGAVVEGAAMAVLPVLQHAGVKVDFSSFKLIVYGIILFKW